MGTEMIGMIGIAILSFVYACMKRSFRSWIWKKITTQFHEAFDGKKIHEEYQQVRDKLIELRIKYDADRVHVSLFSNGSSFTNNKPIWKLSRILEVCDNGIQYTSHLYQNIVAITIWPILSGLFSDSKQAKRVTNNNCETRGNQCQRPLGCYLYDIENIDDSNVKFMLKNDGIQTILQSPIMNGENIVGMLNIEFLDKLEEDVDYCNICETAQEISYILNKRG